MPVISGANSRIRTNIPAQNAYNALNISGRNISNAQLRLSTGKRINNASDDVARYITSRALASRNGTLKSALNAVGDASNVTNITQDALDNIYNLLSTIKDSAATAASGALGTDEKVALAKAAYRLAQQIQTVVDSTVFGGYQLIKGEYKANFYIGVDNTNNLLTLAMDLTTSNVDFNLESNSFNLNTVGASNFFAGVTGLYLDNLNQVVSSDLGIFSSDRIGTTLMSLSNALNNVSKVTAFVGGISNRVTSQEELLNSQIVNYNAAISRLEDADVAQEQLDLIKNQFLQQASLISLTQANQNPSAFLRILQ
jgi:flagellin